MARTDGSGTGVKGPPLAVKGSDIAPKEVQVAVELTPPVTPFKSWFRLLACVAVAAT